MKRFLGILGFLLTLVLITVLPTYIIQYVTFKGVDFLVFLCILLIGGIFIIFTSFNKEENGIYEKTDDSSTEKLQGSDESK